MTYRWFDKCVSLLMTSQGDAAVNFEHSWGDGVAVMSYFNAIFHDSNDNPAVQTKDVATAEPQVTKLGEALILFHVHIGMKFIHLVPLESLIL